MEEAEKIICDFIYEFVNDNWDKINKKKCELHQTKTEFLSEIKINAQTAIWVITEVADWAMDKKYLKEIWVDLHGDYDFYVLKIKDKYIKIKLNDDYGYDINLVKHKTKTIVYFE